MRFSFKNIAALALFILPLLASEAPEVADMGVVKDGVYTNAFFKLTWQLPKNWEIKVGSGGKPANRNYLLLHMIPDAKGTESIDLFAEDNTHAPGFSADYEKRLKEVLGQRGWQQVGGVVQRSVGVDLRLSFEKFRSPQNNVSYTAFAVTPLQGYELKFLLSAGSEKRIDELIQDVIRLDIRPSWELPDSATGLTSAADTTVVGKSEVIQGRLIHKVAPTYPIEARVNKVEGAVIMQGMIDTEGRIRYLYVLEGDPLLSRPAVEAVSKWRYKPYVAGGKPIDVLTQITVRFSLQSPN